MAEAKSENRYREPRTRAKNAGEENGQHFWPKARVIGGSQQDTQERGPRARAKNAGQEQGRESCTGDGHVELNE